MAKESNNALLFAVVFSAFALLIAIQPAAVVDASGCSLTLNRNRVSVTVNSGPCSVRDFPGWCNAYGHGGPRPNSGPLAGRVSFRPLTHTAKGRTHSSVTIRFERCNTCGARGLEVVEAESLFDYDAPTDEGFSGPQPESIQDEPLTHKPGCEFGPA